MNQPEITRSTSPFSPKILLAEDSDDLREAIIMVLAEEGYEMEVAKNGREAVQMFPQVRPDLVILDMRMPLMSGSDACAAIRRLSNLPIIMFTSTNDAPEVKDAILKGATDFVLKSTGLAALTDRIAFHLAQRGAEITATGPAAEKQLSVTPAKQISTTSLIVDPDKSSRAVIKSVLTRLNQNVIEVETAAEAFGSFQKHKPEIVITEWSLPDMDAFNMLTELARINKSKRLYRLLMSNRLSPEAHRKAQFVGITNFLHKPLNGAKAEIMVADSVRKATRDLKRKARHAA